MLQTLLTILSATTGKQPAVERDELVPQQKQEKRPYYLMTSTSLLPTSVSETLLTTEKKITGWQLSPTDLSSTFMDYRVQMRFSNIPKNNIPTKTYGRDQLTDMRVQGYDFSEPPPEYNQDAEEELNTADLHNNPGSYIEILCSFRSVLVGKMG